MYLDKLDKYSVRDIMSNDFVKLHYSTSRKEVIEKMLTHQVGEIIICNDRDELLTLFTFKDIFTAMDGEDDFDITLASEEKKEIVSINPGAKAIEARDLMQKRAVGRLPVMEGKKIIGIVRVYDILNKVYSKVDQMHEVFGTIINNLHEGVCLVDKEGTVILWTERIEKIYNIKSEEILGKKLKEFFPTALLLRALEEKKTIENVYHSPKKDSYAIISAVPIFIEGEFAGAVSTDRDITENTNLSMELESAKEKLDFLQTEVNKIHEEQYTFDKVNGKSEVILEKIHTAVQVAKTNSSVLIGGESGTGKEVFARAIHQASDRVGPFVAINCSAIPENIFESEMFGYEGGAFTGALNKGKVGKVEFADKGTLFLDEIGDMPLYMQAKILRVLQDRQIVRVGGEEPIDVDIRIISATHRDLKAMMTAGKFREDLFYRLNVVNIQLPGLRFRKEDIPLLLNQFIHEFCSENNIAEPKINSEVFQVLMSYDWPGNIRELKNTVEHLVVFSKNKEIVMSSIPVQILEKLEGTREINSIKTFELQENINYIEINTIKKAMEAVEGNKMRAAKLLKIPRSTLYYKIKFHNIKEYL